MVTDREQDYLLSRLKNQTSSGEGSNIPPILKAGLRIPYVTGLKVLGTTTTAAGTDVVIGWNEPESPNNIRCYVAHAFGPFGINQPSTSCTVTHSPAHLLIQSPTAVPIIIKVQTVLNNGLSTSIDDAPSCVSLVPAFT